jgi:hypothetical protein
MGLAASRHAPFPAAHCAGSARTCAHTRAHTHTHARAHTRLCHPRHPGPPCPHCGQTQPALLCPLAHDIPPSVHVMITTSGISQKTTAYHICKQKAEVTETVLGSCNGSSGNPADFNPNATHGRMPTWHGECLTEMHASMCTVSNTSSNHDDGSVNSDCRRLSRRVATGPLTELPCGPSVAPVPLARQELANDKKCMLLYSSTMTTISLASAPSTARRPGKGSLKKTARARPAAQSRWRRQQCPSCTCTCSCTPYHEPARHVVGALAGRLGVWDPSD